jgi:hypothetical protein
MKLTFSMFLSEGFEDSAALLASDSRVFPLVGSIVSEPVCCFSDGPGAWDFRNVEERRFDISMARSDRARCSFSLRA